MAFSTNGGRNRAAMSDINVTPLVDVMLVLLIIFMVTAPMMQEGVSVDLPEAKGAPVATKPETQEIVISVNAADKIFVNDSAVTEESLVDSVREKLKGQGSPDVYLRADKSVPYGSVVRIIASLKSAGISNLGMITTPQHESPLKR
ncbi:MAG: protein TolR [Deltaproteobacteria bacterium]|nr:protein TolR [Deltaproteobacteria bacterium]